MVWAILGEQQSNAIKEIMRSDSDRIIAIVGGAMLDDTLRRTLEERLRNNRDMNDKLFEPSGPLGNLKPRIDLAYQLYLFEDPVRNAFHGIADVRNFFAHRLDASFDSTERVMIRAAAKLMLHQDRTHYPNPFAGGDSEHEIEPIATNRDLFLVNLKLGLILLMEDRSSHERHSNIPLNR